LKKSFEIYKKILLLIVAILFTNSCFSQEITNTTGGKVAGAGVTVSYSVGQMFYTSTTGSVANIVSEGLLQSYEKTKYTYNNS
jgi:hypothetical protein